MILVFLVFSIVLLLYTYLGYPLGMRLVARSRHRTSEQLPSAFPTPSVSVIIPAYNEEGVIAGCLDALLLLEYPSDDIEFLVGSDGSTDRTDEIVRTYAASCSKIKFFPYTARRGKMLVLNDLIQEASGDVLLFVDADILLLPDALSFHIRHFLDPQIAGVAGSLRFVSSVTNSSLFPERLYQTFDEKLRNAESALGATVGVFGGNYSMRRSLWRALPSPLVHDDLFTVLVMLEAKKRIVFEPRAIAVEHYARTAKDEFKRKARFASRGLYTLSFFRALLSPLRGRTALMLWSHKILRWFTPYILLVVALTTFLEYLDTGSLFAMILLIVESSTIAAALIGMVLEKSGVSVRLFQQAWWFLLMSAAFALGIFRYVFRLDRQLWESSTRADIRNTSQHQVPAP